MGRGQVTVPLLNEPHLNLRATRYKRRRKPKPFAGITHKPHCDACAHTGESRSHTPLAPPPRMVMTRGRRRQIDTSRHL